MSVWPFTFDDTHIGQCTSHKTPRAVQFQSIPLPLSTTAPPPQITCSQHDQNTVGRATPSAMSTTDICTRSGGQVRRPPPVFSQSPDFSRSTFSPEGRLFQVEYSLEAIKLGTTAVGVRTLSPLGARTDSLTHTLQIATGEGVILGVEKRVNSTLLEASSVEKILEIDSHIGCAMSGLQADARSMVEHARVESQNHEFNYNERLRVESCTQAICDLALRFGEGADGEDSMMSRPFGVALLIAGVDEDGPQL